MQLGVGTIAFPTWTAAATQAKAHGIDAAGHVKDAVRAKTRAERLDAAVRTMTSFDHVVDNARRLPVAWVLPEAKAAYAGYDAAKKAVDLIVSSGLVPGARQRVGRQQLLAAREEFAAGVEVARRAKQSRFTGTLAAGWLSSTLEDATAATKLLKTDGKLSRDLLTNLGTFQRAAQKRRPVDDVLVTIISTYFDDLVKQSDLILKEAIEASPGVPPLVPATEGRRRVKEATELLRSLEPAPRA